MKRVSKQIFNSPWSDVWNQSSVDIHFNVFDVVIDLLRIPEITNPKMILWDEVFDAIWY